MEFSNSYTYGFLAPRGRSGLAHVVELVSNVIVSIIERAIETVWEFIRLVGDPLVSSYVRRALDIVGKPAELPYRYLRSSILRVWRGVDE